MIRALLLSMVLAGCGCAIAQATPVHGCDSPESRQFDFWVGDWELGYKGPDGKVASSRNRITKTLDGCVLLEQFDRRAK